MPVHFSCQQTEKISDIFCNKTELIKVTFCGNFGEPTFNPNLVDILSTIKNKNTAQFTLTTNGQNTNSSFWKALSQVLTKGDQVIFAIDGFDCDTYSTYRHNGSFSNAVQNAQALMASSGCSVAMKCIIFDYLSGDIKRIQKKAKDYGFNSLITVESKRDVFFNTINCLSQLTLTPPKVSKKSCPFLNSKELYIDAHGTPYPCCWVAETAALSAHGLFPPDIYLSKVLAMVDRSEFQLAELEKQVKLHKRVLELSDLKSIVCQAKCGLKIRNNFNVLEL